jgi:hypothetical protein
LIDSFLLLHHEHNYSADTKKTQTKQYNVDEHVADFLFVSCFYEYSSDIMDTPKDTEGNYKIAEDCLA